MYAPTASCFLITNPSCGNELLSKIFVAHVLLVPRYSFKPRSTTRALTTATQLRPAVYRLPDAGTGKFSLTIQNKIDWSKRLGIDHFKALPGNVFWDTYT